MSPGIGQTSVAGASTASTVKRSPLFFAAAFTGRNGISWFIAELNSRLALPTMPGERQLVSVYRAASRGIPYR